MRMIVMIVCCLQLHGYLLAAYNCKGLEGANSAYSPSQSGKSQSAPSVSGANVAKSQSASSVSDAKGVTGVGMKEGTGYNLIIGNENSRNKVFKGAGGNLFLSAELPNSVRNIGGEEFSVGGEVRVPLAVVPDKECKDETCKDNPRWNRDTGRIEVPKKVYDAMIGRENYSRSRIGRKIGGGDFFCDIKKETIDQTLTHEAVHVAFDEKYLKLDGDDVDVKAQYHFVSEMMAYMIGNGMGPEDAARWAVESAPDELKGKIKALSDAFLKGQFRFRDPEDILKEKANGQDDVQSVSAKMPDVTKLINLYKVAVEYLREINAKSRKPVLISYYQFTAAAVNEVSAILLEVDRMNLTEDEETKLKEDLNDQVCEKVKPYRDTIVSLKRQIEAKGYGHIGDTSYFDHPEHFFKSAKSSGSLKRSDERKKE